MILKQRFMNEDKIMNNLDTQYTALLQDILDNGTKKQTRNGEVLSLFGRQIRHKMSDGFPLLTTNLWLLLPSTLTTSSWIPMNADVWLNGNLICGVDEQKRINKNREIFKRFINQ